MINTTWTLKVVYWTIMSMRSIATTVYEFSTQILMRSDGKLLVKAFNKKNYSEFRGKN